MSWLLVNIWAREGEEAHLFRQQRLLSAAAVASIELSKPRPTIWDSEVGYMKSLIRIHLLDGQDLEVEILEIYAMFPNYLLYEGPAQQATTTEGPHG